MYKDKYISVVIPAYNVKNHLKTVIEDLPEFVDNIIVVDDCCPMKSYLEVNNHEKICILRHEKNMGVGGAVITGYLKSIELRSDIIVKVDGDGQMNAQLIEPLILPIINGRADYTKGNRFYHIKNLREMPIARLIGNSILSFIVKACSGYWNIMDPTNGFIAISGETLDKLNLSNISKKYFFEIDMLINLNIERKVVKDIYMPAIYGSEVSSMNIFNVFFAFIPKLISGFVKRIVFNYFLYDFNMASLYILAGVPLLTFGFIFGAVQWINAFNKNIFNSTGTVMLAVLPILLGVQFILQAINIDINNIPKKE